MTHRDVPRTLADKHHAEAEKTRRRLDRVYRQALAATTGIPADATASEAAQLIAVSDPDLLRGIPVSGGASGTIAGTRPGDSADLLDLDEQHLERMRRRRDR